MTYNPDRRQQPPKPLRNQIHSVVSATCMDCTRTWTGDKAGLLGSAALHARWSGHRVAGMLQTSVVYTGVAGDQRGADAQAKDRRS